LNWSEDVSVQTEKPDVTKGEIFSRPAEQATPRRRTTLPVEREMQSLATADGFVVYIHIDLSRYACRVCHRLAVFMISIFHKLPVFT